MAPNKIGQAIGLQPKAFKLVVDTLIEEGFPNLAAICVVQSQSGERASAICSLHWDDFEDDGEEMLLQIRATNKKTVPRSIVINDSFADWIRASKLVHLKGFSKFKCEKKIVVKNGRTKTFKRQWPHHSDDFQSNMFGAVKVTYYQRIFRPVLPPALEKKQTCKTCRKLLHGIDVKKIRTHSFRHTAVAWMKDHVRCARTIGFVAGMSERRVHQSYNAVTPARAAKTQKTLETYVHAVMQ